MADGLLYVVMFIEVSIDVINKALDPDDLDRDMAIEVIRELTMAVRRNHHVVFIPLLSDELLSQLSKILSRIEIICLGYCLKKKRDLFVLGGRLSLKCIISFNGETKKVQHVLHINPNEVCGFEYNEESHLLTENILDSEFYGCVTKVFQKEKLKNCGAFRTCFFPVQGGGATIKDVFILECKYGHHFCLCIMDSDKKWPNCSDNGQTAKEFEKTVKEWENENGENLKCDYYVMQKTSEIENLIPLSILKHFSSLQSNQFINGHNSVFPWLDLKKGFDYKILYNKDAYLEWKAVMPEIPWTKIDEIKRTSESEDDFKQHIIEANLPQLITPWGGKLLGKVLHPDRKHSDKYNIFEIKIDELLPEQKEEWLRIGEMIFSWCCCFSAKII